MAQNVVSFRDEFLSSGMYYQEMELGSRQRRLRQYATGLYPRISLNSDHTWEWSRITANSSLDLLTLRPPCIDSYGRVRCMSGDPGR